jgi:hypothetical protein
MRRPNRQWRDDLLGSTVRSGLRPIRTAEPSTAVWDRISSELGERKALRRRRVSFHRATLLSLVLLVGVGFAGVGSQIAAHPTSADMTWDQLGEPSLFEQARLARAATSGDLIMPPEPRPVLKGPPKEAFNRGAWMRVAHSMGGGALPFDSVLRQ